MILHYRKAGGSLESSSGSVSAKAKARVVVNL